MEIFSLQNEAVLGAKNGKSCPCGRGRSRCFGASWIFFAGERRYWPGRARSAWQRDWRGRGVGANSYGGSDKARGVRSHLPPAILAAREASHPCRLAVMLAGPFPYRACCVRVAYSSFSTAVQVPSAAERENGCALIPCAVLAGLSAGQRKIAPHGRRQCRKSCPLLPSIMAELRSSRVAGKVSCPGPLGRGRRSENGRQKILSLLPAGAFCL